MHNAAAWISRSLVPDCSGHRNQAVQSPRSLHRFLPEPTLPDILRLELGARGQHNDGAIHAAIRYTERTQQENMIPFMISCMLPTETHPAEALSATVLRGAG